MERLNKYLAHAGIASRRQSDELIATGRVKVDGRVIRDLGIKIDPAQIKKAGPRPTPDSGDPSNPTRPG